MTALTGAAWRAVFSFNDGGEFSSSLTGRCVILLTEFEIFVVVDVGVCGAHDGDFVVCPAFLFVKISRRRES